MIYQLQPPPGLLPMGQQNRLYLRLGFYGYPGSGKTWESMTFPAPLLINPIAEGGYDTALHPDGTYIVQPVVVGRSHAARLRGIPGSVSVIDEVDQWIDYLYRTSVTGQCPWQTVVFGGFSDLASMIYEQCEKESVKRNGEPDTHRAWGNMLAWYQRTLHLLFSLPLHIIIELGVKATMDKDERDKVARVDPDLSGKGGRLVLPRELHALLFTERQGTDTFFTYFEPRVSKPTFYTKNRLAAMRYQQPVQDCNYDTFAQALGLSPIWVCDPGHPRCQPGRWPWKTPWHC